MLPATGILTMSPYSQDGQCGTRQPTIATGNLYRTAAGNNQVLAESHDIAAMPEAKEEVKMRGAIAAIVAGLEKIGPAVHEEGQCEV